MCTIDPDSPFTKWVALLSLALLSATNGFQWINFSSIAKESREYFHMNNYQLNVMPNIYTVVYPVMIIFGCFIFQSQGLKMGLLIGALLNFIGGLGKVVCVLWLPHFTPILLAQFICALSQVFFLSLPPMLAATWFDEKSRTLATAVGALANTFGISLGFPIPPAIVNEHHKGREAFLFLYVGQMVPIAISMFLVLIIPMQPSHRPSITASAQADLTVKDIFPTIRACLRNKSVMLLCLAAGMCNGSLWIFASLLGQLLPPFGISEMKAGWIGFVMTMIGTVTSMFIGRVIDEKRRYREPLLLLVFSAVLMMAVLATLLYFVPQKDLFVPVFVVISAFGAMLAPATPVQLEFTVELAYPMPEALVTSFMLCFSGIFVPSIAALTTYLVGNHPDQHRALILVFTFIAMGWLSCIFVFLIGGGLKRYQLEQVSACVDHGFVSDIREGILGEGGYRHVPSSSGDIHHGAQALRRSPSESSALTESRRSIARSSHASLDQLSRTSYENLHHHRRIKVHHSGPAMGRLAYEALAEEEVDDGSTSTRADDLDYQQ